MPTHGFTSEAIHERINTSSYLRTLAREPNYTTDISHLLKVSAALATALGGLVGRLDAHFGGPDHSTDWKEQEAARSTLALYYKGEG